MVSEVTSSNPSSAFCFLDQMHWSVKDFYALNSLAFERSLGCLQPVHQCFLTVLSSCGREPVVRLLACIREDLVRLILTGWACSKTDRVHSVMVLSLNVVMASLIIQIV